jgi:N-acetyl-1-D-myo-inositol-2-amino-2-deoxy-alpha-D-glucopyranoside deacetylase
LVFVGAHPDDDAFTVSGTVSLLGDDPTLRFVLVLATDGDAGEIAPDVPVIRAQLARHRRAEDATSWRTLGRVPDRVVGLGLPDGGIDRLLCGVLADLVEGVLAEERPDVVVTFGPDGLTGHADHVCVGAATTAAFRRLSARGGPGLHRLLHTGIPRTRFEAWNHDLAAGLPTWDPALPYRFRWIPDTAVDIDVDCASVAGRGVAGVRAHRSQWSYATVPAAADAPLAASLARESWTVAWSDTPLAAPATDVFAGLPSAAPPTTRRTG